MIHDAPTGRSGVRRLSRVSWVLAAMAVGGVLLWRWFGTWENPAGAPGVVAPGKERFAEASATPAPSEPPSTEGNAVNPRSADDRLHRGEGARPAPEVDAGVRGTGNDPSPYGTADRKSFAEPHGALSPSSTVGDDSARKSSPVATGVVPGGGQRELPASRGTIAQQGSPVQPSAEEDEPDTKPQVEGEPDSDHTPPVLQVLRFDPPVVEGGNVTTLTVQASDDLSGVKSVTGEIRSPNGLALLPFASGNAGAGDVRTFAISIPRSAESGIWYVAWISVTDGAANPLLIQARSAATAPAGGQLTVNSSESDSTAPELVQVWFDKTMVSGGERNGIRVEASDDRSGIESIRGACQSPSKSALIWFECSPKEEPGAWEGDVVIPASAECGEWGISQLAIKDKAGNTNLLTGDSELLARAGFRVAVRSDCDSASPTLDNFELSPTIVSSETATEILVTATVHDEGSGVAKITGWFEGPSTGAGQVPKNYFQCSPDPNDPAAPWTGRILVPQHAAKGTWRVGAIRLEDRALNSRDYTSADPEVSGRVFEVR